MPNLDLHGFVPGGRKGTGHSQKQTLRTGISCRNDTDAGVTEGMHTLGKSDSKSDVPHVAKD